MKKTPNPIDQHVGSRVRMQRMLLGKSQEKLASEIGVTFQQVQKYEKGTNRMGASRLCQIAGALGVEVEHFFRGVSMKEAVTSAGIGFHESASPTYASDFLSSAEGVNLTKAFLRIRDPKVRRCIIDLLTVLGGDEK